VHLVVIANYTVTYL